MQGPPDLLFPILYYFLRKNSAIPKGKKEEQNNGISSIQKGTFCTDFSENADYAFEFAYGIAKRDDGLLYILHVIPGNPQEAFSTFC